MCKRLKYYVHLEYLRDGISYIEIAQSVSACHKIREIAPAALPFTYFKSVYVQPAKLKAKYIYNIFLSGS